ncbi:MAG TPA: HAMP domain-containing sensor histidine kinase [Bacteroidia bacterium]|jgi:signal transduction histidine kinase|nr:HAMP domain-containing sensor histidine kinase [Bacteroidia bacterium]
MKLLYKNIIINSIASLVIICIGGVITYFFIVHKIKQESREHLASEKASVVQSLKNGLSPSQLQYNIGDEILVKEINNPTHKEPFFTSLTKKENANEEYEEDEGEEPFFEAQAIVFECAANNKYYTITIVKSFDNDEALGKNILNAVMISALLMILAIVFINTFIYRKIWAPFYFTLKVLRNFTISKRDTLSFPKAKTAEFEQLNTAITMMAKKISHDYLSLKEFTENASHEIQTPLAVINSKIEMCLQDTQLTPEQAKMLMEASYAVNNLVNLNKGLIVLTKLDNNQIDLPVDVNISKKIYSRLNLFEDFIQEKDIDINLKIDDTITIKIDPVLAGILLDNLIKNAIKHNFAIGGKINIEVTKDFIKIENTGPQPKVSTDKFFERFYKEGSAESLGLGLAIAKKICDIYNFNILYDFKEGLHIITLHIKQA